MIYPALGFSVFLLRKCSDCLVFLEVSFRLDHFFNRFSQLLTPLLLKRDCIVYAVKYAFVITNLFHNCGWRVLELFTCCVGGVECCCWSGESHRRFKKEATGV